MPVEMTQNLPKVTSFRPPKHVLDVFWSLSDGTDDQRNAGTVKLTSILQSLEGKEKQETMKYCKERLVRGLSSGRKFARVGFSMALTQLLRKGEEITAGDVLTTVKEKLKVVRHEKKSKAEVGGIYLGRAFAVSAIVQARKVGQLSGELLDSVVDELVSLAEKKSYLQPVCNKIMEDLVRQMSVDTFGEQVWPKLRDKMKEGWDSCTLEKLSLLLVCRQQFPEVVNKKFLKKHWGFPLFSEDNDVKLMKVIQGTGQRAEVIMEQILSQMLESDRDVLSVWSSIGGKLLEYTPGKRADLGAQRKLLALIIAAKLLPLTADTDQLLNLVLSPELAHCLFHSITTKSDPVAAAANSAFEQVSARLKSDQSSLLSVIERVWKVEATLDKSDKSGRVDLVNSHNFLHLVDMLSPADAESYASVLVSSVMGVDKWQILSGNPTTRQRQNEECLRQLQHIITSQHLTTPSAQRTALTLFLRLSFFQVLKKTKTLQHCESCVNFEDESSARKLCEGFFFKSLDSLSTLNPGQQKSEQLHGYIDLLYELALYCQTLLKAETVKPLKVWSGEMLSEWDKLMEFVMKIKQKSERDVIDHRTAFLLLLLFLGLQKLMDQTVASQLLQDVFVCYEKAEAKKKNKKMEDDSEPEWVEVVTEVLLNMLSLQSHLSRVVTAAVFKSLSASLTPAAVGLITEVLIPKPRGSDDAGGVLVDADNDDDEEEEELDAEEAGSDEDESSPDDDGDDDNDDNAESEEDMEDEDVNIDDNFRQSVKEALGEAADDDSGEDEDLPDLDDEEMFKLDDMLAEVFRQRRKIGGKKAREQKKKEMANFRIRVLDLVEILVKSERCGDFVLDIIKPLLLLMMKTNPSDSQALLDRSKAIFKQLKARVKQGLSDGVHSAEDQHEMFQQLLELARTVTDAAHLQNISTACYIVMKLQRASSDSQEPSMLSRCRDLVENCLHKVIMKKQSKPHPSFFVTLIELDQSTFQVLSTMLLHGLKEESTKTHGRMMCCSLLASLCKKTDNMKESEQQLMKTWTSEAASVVTKLLVGGEGIKVMLYKDLLSLAVALQTRSDLFPKPPFDVDVKNHLMEVKPKFNTDLRRLANKVIASIDRSQSAAKSSEKKKKKKKKKKKNEEDSIATPPAKKRKIK